MAAVVVVTVIGVGAFLMVWLEVVAAGIVIGTVIKMAVGFEGRPGMWAVVVEIGLTMMMATVVEEALLVVARGLAEVAVLLHDPVTMLSLVAVAVVRHLLKVVQAVGLSLLSHTGGTAVAPQLLMAGLLVAVLSAAMLLVFVLAVMMMMGGVAVLQASKALLPLLLNKLQTQLDSVLKLQEKQL